MTPSPSGSALGCSHSQAKQRAASTSGSTAASSAGVVTRASAATARTARPSPSGSGVEQAPQQRVDHRGGRVGVGPRRDRDRASATSTSASGEPPAHATAAARRPASSRRERRAARRRRRRPAGSAGRSSTTWSQPALNQLRPGAWREAMTTSASAGRRGSMWRRRCPSSAARRSHESSRTSGRRAVIAGASARSSSSASGASPRASTVDDRGSARGGATRELAHQGALAHAARPVEQHDVDRRVVVQQPFEARPAPRPAHEAGRVARCDQPGQGLTHVRSPSEPKPSTTHRATGGVRRLPSAFSAR